jgi:hypothetical protein
VKEKIAIKKPVEEEKLAIKGGPGSLPPKPSVDPVEKKPELKIAKPEIAVLEKKPEIVGGMGGVYKPAVMPEKVKRVVEP